VIEHDLSARVALSQLVVQVPRLLETDAPQPAEDAHDEGPVQLSQREPGDRAGLEASSD
jgi:hypothetical protein